MPEPVSYKSNNLKIAGLWYSAEGVPKGQKSPSIVLTHPASSIKEQSPANYAPDLAKAGYNVLTFDAAYQGESEGTPRYLEDPSQRLEDIKSGVTYLTTRDDVDSDRIGLVGICAGGQYSFNVHNVDTRVKATAVVSAADISGWFLDGLDMANPAKPEFVHGLLQISAQDRLARAKGENPEPMPVLPATREEALAQADFLADLWDYYRTRQPHERAPNLWAKESLDRILQWSSFSVPEGYTDKPYLAVVGSKAVSRPYSEKSISLLKGPTELYIVDGATHGTLYDLKEHVGPATVKIAEFLDKYLK